KSSELIADNI
ncbi:ribosomal protein L17, partial [Escherichia coli 95.1288]